MNRSLRPTIFAVVACICAGLLAMRYTRSRSSDASGVDMHTLRFGATEYKYFVFVPASTPTSKSFPLLFLVHGGGGNGLHFLRLWQEFARENQIVLLAPTLPVQGDLEKDVAELFPAFVEDAKATYPNIDSRRIYVFGYSFGGYSTFDSATLDSTYFAAVTILAGVITPDYDWILGKARRKTPIAMYMGDRDRRFSLAQARRTRDVLLAHGFPVHYVEIAQQHDFYSQNFAWVQQDSWNFMRNHALAMNPEAK